MKLKNLRKIVVCFLFFMAVNVASGVFSRAAFAADAWSKLGRGLANVTGSFLEIFNQPLVMAETNSWPVAMFGGVPKGIAMMGVRILTGVYEIATFPLPWPNHYGPILYPEYVGAPPYEARLAPMKPVS